MQIINYTQSNYIKYPIHTNLTNAWTFGSMLFFLIALQTVTGIFLACYYIPLTEHALQSIIFIIKEINGGWLAYRLHVIGSNFIFVVLYLHLIRGFYYELYRWENRYSWWSGYVLFLLIMLIAFLGYVLPWGQMSYWAITVIINMFTVFPNAGQWWTSFLWGGSVVNMYTLQRAFLGHIVLPFVLIALGLLHISFIHSSNNDYLDVSVSTVWYATQTPRLANPNDLAYEDLYPLYMIKDLIFFLAILFILMSVVTYNPEFFTNRSNWIPANPSVTPRHICPEWYFLPFYGIIKLIPSKLYGILIMLLTIITPLTLPFLSCDITTRRS